MYFAVIPRFLSLSSGKPVLIVNGAYRGTRAVLEELDVDNYCVRVKITQVCGCTCTLYMD